MIYILNIPCEASEAVELIKEVFEDRLVGIYLYGSFVLGGLKPESDLDLLVITNSDLTTEDRKDLTHGLMGISGEIGNKLGKRFLEVTVFNENSLNPFSYPPKYEYIYGEWDREDYKSGKLPETTYDPDGTILLAQARENSVTLFGEDIKEIILQIGMEYIIKALKADIPILLEGVREEGKNTVLTLARIWYTVFTEKITSKDNAANWAMAILPKEQGALLNLAKEEYLGNLKVNWNDKEEELVLLVEYMKKEIEKLLED